MPPLLVIDRLVKRFGSFTAVDEVSLAVQPGEIFGFLGPNGAGKTTTIKMLAGLLQPDGGRITIDGHDLAQEPIPCKQVTGYIPDRPYLYEKLTGQEFLRFIASLYGVSPERLAAISSRFLGLFHLSEWQDHLIESYSHGMRQKLIITAALLQDPKLIIVDEPMVGLDPQSARIVKELFKGFARSGKAIFLSTHSLEVAEELCDRIAIILNGRIRALGDLASLRQEARLEDSGLEEIFLELTGSYELRGIIEALRSDLPPDSASTR
ncbi:MAG: ABC transporter ATP-binding protein [Thermodesulfobacteriota bacterium]